MIRKIEPLDRGRCYPFWEVNAGDQWEVSGRWMCESIQNSFRSYAKRCGSPLLASYKQKTGKIGDPISFIITFSDRPSRRRGRS